MKTGLGKTSEFGKWLEVTQNKIALYHAALFDNCMHNFSLVPYHCTTVKCDVSEKIQANIKKRSSGRI